VAQDVERLLFTLFCCMLNVYPSKGIGVSPGHKEPVTPDRHCMLIVTSTMTYYSSILQLRVMSVTSLNKNKFYLLGGRKCRSKKGHGMRITRRRWTECD
jgi:hypothetical protein